MKAIFSVASFLILSWTTLSHASGPNEITAFEVRAVAGQSQVCIKTYAGWGESEWICSAAVANNDRDLADARRFREVKQNLIVGYFKNGFSVKNLVDSMAVNNCEMTRESQFQVKQIKEQIRQLNEQVKAIENSSLNRTCE